MKLALIRKFFFVKFAPLVLLLIACIWWEGYIFLGRATGDIIPFTSIKFPVRTDITSMPHLWDIFGALFRPARRGGEEILLTLLINAALFTGRIAVFGFLFGSFSGFGVGVVLAKSAAIERILFPYVLASQTVPLLAIAPMVVIWGGKLNLPVEISIVILSSYLCFFPVAINTFRGLRSVAQNSIDVLRSCAASDFEILMKLQIPTALPYIFAALKLAANASIIGAIIGELPTGVSHGVGRILLTFSYYFISGPAKLFSSALICAALGMAFSGLISMAEQLVLAKQNRILVS